MSPPLVPMDIARLWAASFAGDPFIAQFAETHYSRPFSIQIGADMRRPPSENDAPFIALFPDAGQTGPQLAEAVSEIGIVAGVDDGSWVDVGGVRELGALARLGELCPLLERAMREALPKARMVEIATEFEIMQFPLCMALITVTVEESLPIGRR